MKLLLTGPPGIGKTTVIQKVLQGIDLTAGGFFTQEMRKGGRRVGFSVKTLDGKEGVLAHIDYKGRYRVGRYGVNVSLFEAMALPELETSLRGKELIVIDEIGKMELFSQRFRKMVKQILDQEERHLLGVIHYGREPFVASIKKRRDVDVISVTSANRDGLPSQIIMRLQKR
ncbi:MAG: NTPase [Deltaproteobacteria bacterium]|nr:MAG: NTPase [Deltaproteobacteria bacterium]